MNGWEQGRFPFLCIHDDEFFRGEDDCKEEKGSKTEMHLEV